MAGSHAAEVLKSGDMLLAVNGRSGGVEWSCWRSGRSGGVEWPCRFPGQLGVTEISNLRDASFGGFRK